MIVSIIVAMDENGGIGIDNHLPWHLPADLRRFKQITMGHYLIMGRRTFESIGKLLPGRKVIILSRQPKINVPGVENFTNLEDAIQFVNEQGETEVFIAGGREVYQSALPYTNRIYLTLIHSKTTATVYFPEIDWKNWQEIECEKHEKDENHPYAFTFKILQKNG